MRFSLRNLMLVILLGTACSALTFNLRLRPIFWDWTCGNTPEEGILQKDGWRCGAPWPNYDSYDFKHFIYPAGTYWIPWSLSHPLPVPERVIEGHRVDYRYGGMALNLGVWLLGAAVLCLLLQGLYWLCKKIVAYRPPSPPCGRLWHAD